MGQNIPPPGSRLCNPHREPAPLPQGTFPHHITLHSLRDFGLLHRPNHGWAELTIRDQRSLSVAAGTAELIVVGTGLYGLTIAECAARQTGAKVVMLDARKHLGGNAYSYTEPATNVEVHAYGSHLFHTSNPAVWEYVNRFTAFNSYQHSVYTLHDSSVFSLPFNLLTMSQIYGRSLSPQEARDQIARDTEGLDSNTARNLEEKAIASVGRPIYEALIRGYTLKQWQTDPSDLPPEVISRLPVRFNFNNRYFSDTWEGLPLNGYAAWLEKMVNSPNISVFLETDFFDVRSILPKGVPVVYTGALDRFFDYRHGLLSWRTLDFDLEVLTIEDFQGTAVMNYADADVSFTRIHEFKHLHPERGNASGTVIMHEYSRFAGRQDEPYYPVNSPEDRVRLLAYREMARDEPGVHFGGRLGTYQYLDMHMAIASAQSAFRRDIQPAIQIKRERSQS